MSENDTLSRNSENKKFSKGLYRASLVCIVAIICIIGAGFIWLLYINQNSDYVERDVKIALITDNDDYNRVLYKKLSLDNGITLDKIEVQYLLKHDLNDYDIVVVSNVDLGRAAVNKLDDYVKSSKDHSVMFLIDETTDGDDLKALNITKDTDTSPFMGDNELGYGICKDTEEERELTKNIEWNNMPEVRNYTLLTESDFYTKDAKESSVVLKDYSDKDSEDVYLFYKDLRTGGKYLVFTIWFDAKLNKNEITESWPYIGYFFYSCFMFLEDEPIPSYRYWPSSPVPNNPDIIFFAIFFGSLAVGSFLAFIYAFRYSRTHPLTGVESLETDDEKKAKQKAQEKIDELKKESEKLLSTEDLEKLTKKTKEEAAEEQYTYEKIEKELPEYLKGWNAVGIHRQISGFWMIFFVAIVLVLPVGIFFIYIFPTFIFPSPSGQGFYSFVVNFFGALWTFLDLGTHFWMMRKFAAYRISEPKKAIASAQCMVWYQVLSGAFQILLVGFMCAIGFPSTIYAHLTYIFTWYSLFQFLGFFMVFIYILNSLQRVDVAGVGVAVLAPLLVLFQIIIVPIFVKWGASDPEIGIALGGAIGSSLANFVTNLLMFFVSWWVFRRTFHFSGSTIFRVDFDGSMFKDMLKWGLKYTPGQMLVPLVWTLQVVLLSIYLDNYNNWLGYWNIAYTVVQASAIIGLFAAAMAPALSEAKENNKPNLVNYDLTAMFKWTNNLNFWISAAMFAILVPLIMAITPPSFQSVALLIPLLVFFQLLGPYSWLADSVFVGMDHPLYATWTWILEQGSRAILMLIFVPLLAPNPSIGMFSIMFAYIPALIIKIIAVWLLIKKKIIKDLKFYPFKTLIAPGLAAIVFYFLILGALMLAGGGLIGAIVGAAFALIIGPFVFFFFSGLFGGWSKNGLEEFKRSISIMGVVGKFANGIYACCRAGARICPWSESGDIKIYYKARVEAWELTLEKKKMGKM